MIVANSYKQRIRLVVEGVDRVDMTLKREKKKIVFLFIHSMRICLFVFVDVRTCFIEKKPE